MEELGPSLSVGLCVSGGPVGGAGGCEAGGRDSSGPWACPFQVGAGGLRSCGP